MVDSLIYPVILGTDFLHEHHLRLDFTSLSVTIQYNTSDVDCIQPLWDATAEPKAERFATAAISTSLDHDIVEECSVPHHDKLGLCDNDLITITIVELIITIIMINSKFISCSCNVNFV